MIEIAVKKIKDDGNSQEIFCQIKEDADFDLSEFVIFLNQKKRTYKKKVKEVKEL